MKSLVPLLSAGLLAAGCSGAGSSAAQGRGVPTAPPGYVAFDPFNQFSIPASAKLPVDTAFLVGPHYSLRVDAVAYTDRLTASQSYEFDSPRGGDDNPLKAGPGRRFMVVRTGKPMTLPALETDEAPSTTGVKAEVRVGGTRVPLPGGISELDKDYTFLVNVPATGDPMLAVTDAGRTQSLDLAAGKRGGDAIAGYYPLIQGAGPRTGEDGRVNGSSPYLPYKMSVDVRKATLQPYVPGGGWAKKGRAWLYLSGDADTQWLGGKRFGVHLDTGRTFTLAAGGRTVAAKGHASVGGDPSSIVPYMSNADIAVYFNVPAGFRTGSLYFRPSGTFRQGGHRVSWTPLKPPPPVKIHLHS